MPMDAPLKKRGRPPKPKEAEGGTLVEAGQNIVKSKSNGRNSPVIGDNGILVKGDAKKKLTSRLLKEALATYDMPRVKSDEELKERIANYFKQCAQSGEKPTVEQMSQVTGYSIQTVWDWENGINKGFSTETSEVIKKAKNFLRVFDAKLLMEGAYNPVSYIFRAKNYYGMKDVQDYILTPNQPLGAEGNPTEASQKYQKAMPGGPASIMAEGEIE